MEILCLTASFNRPYITQIFLEGMKRLGISVYGTCSDVNSRRLYRDYDVKGYSFIPNTPLGRKWNWGAEDALQFTSWTHLLISGDDNVYGDAILEKFDQHKKKDFIGLRNLYFMEPESMRAVKFRYEEDKPRKVVGAGRLLSRRAVEKASRSKDSFGGGFCLWDNTLNSGLDRSADMSLFEAGYFPYAIDGDEYLMVDIKSSQNIWKFDQFAENDPVDFSEPLSIMGENERELIQRLTTLK